MFFFSFKFLRIIFEGLSLNFATKILFFRDIRKKNLIYFSKNLKKVYFLSKIQLPPPKKPQPFFLHHVTFVQSYSYSCGDEELIVLFINKV